VTLLAAVAYLALFTALSWPAQDDGYTQSAHYALVRSLATGTPRVDTFYRESGDLSYWHGHYYSVKAPGVAFVALPAYAALDAVGLWPDGRRGALRLLALISSVLPALALVLLVGRVADELEPGSGLAVGLTLAVATIVMPLSTVAFSHIWSALLAFATFAVLLHERRRQARLRLVAAAGVLAGLGVLFEYPTALAGLVLGILAISRRRWLVRGLAYTGGVLLGIAPLLAYNDWAFGSPFHISYVNAIVDRGVSGHDVVGSASKGLFGVTWPSLRTISELLLESRGLLITTPIVAAGIAGLVLLIRGGRDRAAVWTALAIAIAYLVYNAGVTTPFGGAFGGWSPGPRYLVTALPFALVALGVAYRRAPAPVIALAAVSVVTMTVVTATTPLVPAENVRLWWAGLKDNELTHTVGWLLGWKSTGFAPATPFLFGVGLVAVIAAHAFVSLRRPTMRELPAVVATLAAWAYTVTSARPLVLDHPTETAGALALMVLAVAVALAVLAIRTEPETLHLPVGPLPDASGGRDPPAPPRS